MEGGVKTSIHPKDESLQLPQRAYSYELQRSLVKASVQGPFDEAIERIEENTGVTVSNGLRNRLLESFRVRLVK
jgi:hypothetical protein